MAWRVSGRSLDLWNCKTAAGSDSHAAQRTPRTRRFTHGTSWVAGEAYAAYECCRQANVLRPRLEPM